MKFFMWYVVGFLCVYQASVILPGGSFTETLWFFISNPDEFVVVSVFVLSSFLMLSYSIKYGLMDVIQISHMSKNKALVSMSIQCLFLVLGFIFTFSMGVWLPTALMVLICLYLLLSLDDFKQARSKKGR